MSEQEASQGGPNQGQPVWQHHPWWTTFASGRIYRPVMRLMHRLGWCYPQPMPIDNVVWCHWCGMRGRR